MGDAGLSPMPPRERPIRRPIASVMDFIVRGARPVGLWVGLLTILVHGVVLPIASLWGIAVAPLNTVELLGIASLTGLGWHQRTVEKREGLTT